jgi:hypothetical protein
MTHLTNDAIRKSLKSAGLGDEKTDTMEFGEILEYLTPSPTLILLSPAH